jgi:hypothetical protein
MLRRGVKTGGWTLAALAVAALPLSIARAGDPPKIKEGLWAIHGESIEKPGDRVTQFDYKLCRNHAYDKAANAKVKDAPGCRTVVKDSGGGKFEAASACTAATTKIISNGTTTYLSETAMHSETHATYTPPFRGKTEETMTQDQQYVSECPSNMKPGDVLFPDGFVRHPD